MDVALPHLIERVAGDQAGRASELLADGVGDELVERPQARGQVRSEDQLLSPALHAGRLLLSRRTDDTSLPPDHDLVS
jgi:hypothetical protein